MAKEGKFREDLYFRLSMFHIHIPPLRERTTDIVGLVDYLVDRLRRETGRSLAPDAEVRELLCSYQWPGNVRQLENVINRAYILADGENICLADLPPEISRVAMAERGAAPSVAAAAESLREQVRRFEAGLIARSLEAAGGDRRAAAERLGIGLSSLYRKIDELGEYGLIK